MLEHDSAALIMIDAQSRVSTWNEGARRLFGYSAEEVLGRDLLTFLIPSSDTEIHREYLENLRAGATVPPHRGAWVHQSGRFLDLTTVASAVTGEDGASHGAILILHPPGQRHLIHRGILQSLGDEATLRLAVNEHALLAITDASGVIQYANDRFCEVSQYSTAELIGQTHALLKSGRQPQEFYAELWETISAGRVWRGEICNRARDGSLYWVTSTIVPLLDQHGKVEEFIAITTDITPRLQALDSLKKRTEELERSNRALEEFASAASHDLREPLRGVSGCIQILQERYFGKIDAEADELIAHSVLNINRMQQLIQGLLDFARVDRASMFERVHARTAVEAAVHNLKAAVEESGVTVEIGPMAEVTADQIQLIQLFQNLLSNAIKFRGKESPKIWVRSKAPTEEEAEFIVRDNGIGIDPKHWDWVFGMFHRIHAREAFPGTGIGLSICKRIVERHGGRIWLESTPGVGTEFHFTIGESTPGRRN